MSFNVDWATFGNKIFPVGTVLTFYDTSDHSDFLGLTWARFAAGRMVIGYNSSDSDFATIGNTGGEKEHTLTIAEMPRHNGHVTGISTTAIQPGGGVVMTRDPVAIGDSHAHNNMPPYIVAALWRRTA